MDGERRRALSSFYRDEFIRHIEHLHAVGILDDCDREATEKALVTHLDELCGARSFSAVAEMLLRRFDVLSGFSSFDPRLRH